MLAYAQFNAADDVLAVQLLGGSAPWAQYYGVTVLNALDIEDGEAGGQH